MLDYRRVWLGVALLAVGEIVSAGRAWERSTDSDEIRVERDETASSGEDMAQRYAASLQTNMLSTGHCARLIEMMNRVAGTDLPAAVRMRQIDKVFDASDRAGCVIY